MNKFIEEYKASNIKHMSRNLAISVLVSILAITLFYTSARLDAHAQTGMVYDINAMIEVTRFSSMEYEVNDEDTNFFSEEPIEFEYVRNLAAPFEIENVEEYNSIVETEEIVDEQDDIVEEINTYFSGYVDISSNNGVTAEMLDEASAYYQKYQTFDNQFVDQGWIFLEAQEQSGIDALWLYAVAVYESGWGTSSLAVEKGNYYGIGAWDSDITKAKSFDNTLYDGIVGGAIWISENYYQKGYTTMVAMNSVPHHSYAPGNEIWIPTISDFINNFYYNWRKTT